MPKPNLSAMSIDALVKLREDINQILDRKANDKKPTFDAGWWCRRSTEGFAQGQESPAEVSQPIR
jgi:hypothetical protein